MGYTNVMPLAEGFQELATMEVSSVLTGGPNALIDLSRFATFMLILLEQSRSAFPILFFRIRDFTGNTYALLNV